MTELRPRQPDEISALIASKIASEIAASTDVPLNRDFCAGQCAPRSAEVQFSGGFTQTCWQVTKSDGDYAVYYLPRAGYFALCVDSALGPLDIGVHGSALGCFGSV